MRLAAERQLEAFAEVVRRHEPRIRAWCAKYLGDAAAGDDVAQEVFLEAWRVRSRYWPSDSKLLDNEELKALGWAFPNRYERGTNRSVSAGLLELSTRTWPTPTIPKPL